jgi:archaeal flagellar protein FlaH
LIPKHFHTRVTILALLLFLVPLIIPNAFAVSYTLNPTPARTTETSINTATAVDLVLTVSQATTGTTYQFQWSVTDPAGNTHNHNNQTTPTTSSFQISLEYPRDFGTNMILAGNYTVNINQNQPYGASNPVATGQFTVGLTDKTVYQRTSTVQINIAGYGNGEAVTLNISQGTTTYYSGSVNANTSGQVSTSWQVPFNAPLGTWTVTLTGTSTVKAVPDTQTFTVLPINVTLSPLTLGQATLQKTQSQSVSFTATYQTGPTVTTGTARVRFTEPDGVTSFYTTANYNLTTANFQTRYAIPANGQTGSWTAAVDPGTFNDGSGNTGPATSITKAFTVNPANVTISQLTVTTNVLQRSQTESFSFPATYPSGAHVQTGTGSVQVTEPDGTTTFTIPATYNSTTGLFQSTSKIQVYAETGVYVASVDPNSFNDGNGNTGPITSVLRGFTVQPAILTITVVVSNQTYTLGQVMPIYVVATYPDGTPVTSGNITVTFTTAGNQTGNPVTLTYVQGQSRWAGSYIVRSTDISGLWIATVKAVDSYGNTGQQTQAVVVSVPARQPSGSTTPQSLNLYWFLIAALAFGSGGSGLLILRRVNLGEGPFDQLFTMTGGELSPSSTIMILGDAGSGTTTLSLELIHRHLLAGKYAGLLAYDAFPQEVQRNMRSFGWDVSNYLKDGSFKILDCYSALAGIENSQIRDPVDFTEISIRVSQMIEDAGMFPFMLVLDSLAPIFNGTQAQTTINFLRVLSAKVKNNSGILVLTGARGSIPEQVRSSLENIVDGVLELNIMREGKRIMRTLTVRRLAGRTTSPLPAEFDILAGKGIVFRKPRIPLKILTPKRKASQF